MHQSSRDAFPLHLLMVSNLHPGKQSEIHSSSITVSCCHSAWLPLVCAKEERAHTCNPIFSSLFSAWLELTLISAVCLFELKAPAVWMQFLNQQNNYAVKVHHTSARDIISDIFISNK